MEKVGSQRQREEEPDHLTPMDDAIQGNDQIHEVMVIDWDGDDDPANPLNWSTRTKVFNCTLISISSFLTPLASSVLAPGVPALMAEFESTSSILASLVVSIYVIGFAAGPLFMAPLSEIYGRSIVYHVCNVGFVASTVACAVAPSLGSLIAFRFFAGVFGSAAITNGSGTVADMVRPANRGAAMSALISGPLFGPVIGPIGGSFLAAAKGWRWTFWLVTIVAGCLTIAMFIGLRETYPPVLLQRQARRLRQQCPVTANHNCARSVRDEGLSRRRYLSRSIIRPLRLLFLSPICSVFALYMAVVYGYLYLMFTSITTVFQDMYGFNDSVVGLVFLGLGIGALLGLALFSVTNDRYSRRQAEKNGDGHKPEYRLGLLPYAAICLPVGLFIYGWTTEYSVHWFVPIASHAIVCTAAGRASECQFQTQQLSPSSPDVASAKFSSLTLFLRGKSRLGTATSWITLMWEFEEIRPFLFGLDPEYNDMFNKIRRLKNFFPPVEDSKFPFGAPPTSPEARCRLFLQLPDRQVAETLLSSYLETFEALFPLWHESSYNDEMARFWESPKDADTAFLAQLYMMMALGCQTMPRQGLEASRLDAQALTKCYLGHAATAFNCSHYAATYSYAGLRTLCMSVFARMMDLITQDDVKDSAVTVGFAVRVAQTMNMHRHPSHFIGMQEAEMANRIKIWSTLVLLDHLASIRSSLPPVVHSGGYDACVGLQKDLDFNTPLQSNVEIKAAGAFPGSTSFEHVLAEFLPTASRIVGMANSVNQELDYENVEKLDRELREALGKAINLYDPNHAASATRKLRLQSEMLQIIIRRVILILHEPFGRSPDAALNFKPSHIALLECSLALAVSQGDLYDEFCPSGGMRWALNLFKEDFLTALANIALGIRHQEFDTEPSTIFKTPPKIIAWNTLRRAVEITGKHVGDSKKHYLLHSGVCYLIAGLESLELGSPIREKMVETSQYIINLIEKVKGRQLDTDALDPSFTESDGDIASKPRLGSYQKDERTHGECGGDLRGSIFS
ncbi:Efflux pump radE [Paramyrothecium foliicola]|nr:Efflux pump radE [Paramyrothecium foliicola]